MELKESILELLRRAATDLSPDVEEAVLKAYQREDEGSAAKGVFNTIRENIVLAREKSTPICQDTGSLIFYIDYPVGHAEKPTGTPFTGRQSKPPTCSTCAPMRWIR